MRIDYPTAIATLEALRMAFRGNDELVCASAIAALREQQQAAEADALIDELDRIPISVREAEAPQAPEWRPVPGMGDMLRAVDDAPVTSHVYTPDPATQSTLTGGDAPDAGLTVIWWEHSYGARVSVSPCGVAACVCTPLVRLADAQAHAAREWEAGYREGGKDAAVCQRVTVPQPCEAFCSLSSMGYDICTKAVNDYVRCARCGCRRDEHEIKP